jgi:hypothetical protein
MQGELSESKAFMGTKHDITYFPAKLWHSGQSGEVPLGLPRCERFYIECAYAIWKLFAAGECCHIGGKRHHACAVLGDLRTHDSIMKHVQLRQLLMHGTVMLIDESQDLGACQFNWLMQHNNHMAIFIVGDEVQRIYSFRGAKGTGLLGLQVAANRDTRLTASFRFGKQIAALANVILFLKEHSPQPWSVPYRLQGCAMQAGYVTIENLTQQMASPKTRAKQLTIIARSNTGLLQEVLPVRCNCPTNTLTCVVQLILMESTTHLKFALNGNGDTSGHQKWKDAIRKVHHFYKLYM